MIASVKVPTTHDHPDGVAAGIVAGLERLLREHAIDPSAIAFIAHSTTQATNALLEGDVARSASCARRFARRAMRFAPIRWRSRSPTPDSLAPELVRRPRSRWFDARARPASKRSPSSEAFAVDRPEREAALVARRARGSSPRPAAPRCRRMYGLRARTRTAALNAAILPRMLRTSRVTRAPSTTRAFPRR
jgi:N-methylhydantoinase A/oxoprolinase/acetone carboxylase beta subunit